MLWVDNSILEIQPRWPPRSVSGQPGDAGGQQCQQDFCGAASAVGAAGVGEETVLRIVQRFFSKARGR